MTTDPHGFRSADLPKRARPLWRMAGPGAVLVGLSIGAGEIVIWPRIVAEHGASMIWAAVLGVFLQLWLNIEIGRWAIATGESVYAGLHRLWAGFVHIIFFLLIAQYLLPAWARSSGLAVKALIFGPEHSSPDWFWTAVTYLAVVVVLFGPRRIYTAVERTIMALVVFITVGLVFIALRVGSFEVVQEMARGAVNIGYVEPGFSIRELFGALVFAGAGGAANLFYAFYLRDKGIGMGARVPMLTNPFRGRQEGSADHGFRFPETPENRSRFRDWLTFVKLDQTLFFWLLNTFTIFLFIFGALAVLHPQGIVPQAGRFIWDEATILADQMGPAGRYLFLLIGAATLFSTQVALIDGSARSLADMVRLSSTRARATSYPTWYARMAVGMIVIGFGLGIVMETLGINELGFVFNAAYMGGFCMAVYTPLTLWMNLRYLPKSARPRPLNVTMMLVASATYVGFALYSIGYEIGLVR